MRLRVIADGYRMLFRSACYAKKPPEGGLTRWAYRLLGAGSSIRAATLAGLDATGLVADRAA